MKREKNYKTAKFIEALEHIDPKYVEEAGKKIKERQTGQTVAGMSRAKSLRQVFALVACVLLLSAIIPAVTYLVGHLPDIIGSSTGDDTTEQTSPETPPEETSSPAPETTVTETTIEETTSEETTSEPETTECTHSEYICTENMPTCTESAIIEYGCMLCGHSWSKTEPPLGHDFKDGVCTRCGEKEPITDGSQGLEYRIEGDHAVLVGIGTCTDKEIIVASTYNGLPVTGIDSFEISGNKGITSVTVSEGVTHIEVCAFSGCPDLRAVYLPSTLQFLSSGEGIAFANCDNIDTIKVADSNPKYYSVGNCLIERGTGNLVLACSKSVLPSDGSIKSIGEFAFGGSDSLEKIVIPEGVTVINPYAFAGCASLKSVTFPDSLTTVRWDAFANCTSLESVKLGDNVTEIGSRVFSGCSSLVDITLPGRVDSFGEEIFAGCPIESIVIPDGVKTLHGGMFANCRKLKSVTLPDGIETIVGFAFAYCSSLEKITLPRSVTKIQGEVFADCSNLTEFTFKGTKAEWNAIEKQDGWNDGCPFTVIHCSDGDLELYEYDGSQGLEYKISDDGKYAILVGIGTCTDKDIVTATTYNGLPVTFVDFSFSKISNVTSITLSDSVLTIGGIDNMPDLAEVYFSKSVESINPESLIGCPKLEIIEVDKDNPKYYSAGNCLIEKSTKTIVHGCKGSVIPTDGSVTAIGEFAFHACDWLTELTIPEGIERIDAYSFAGCDSLRRVRLPDSVTYLGFGAFFSCESLESINLGSGLETLGGSVFEDCPKLMELTLPKTTKLLCALAFFECKSLKKVSYEGTMAEWMAIEKTAMWSDGAAFTVVHCSDGEVFAKPLSYDEATELARQYWSPIESGYFVCYASDEMYLLVRPDEVIVDRIYIDRYTGEISVPKLTYPDIPDSLLKVLLNETTYIRQFDYESEGYFKDTVLDYPTAETGSFGYAVCDLDGDGKAELILSSMQYEIVLREFEGKVYGYLFDFRSLLDLKTDGSFNFISNAGMTYGTARLNFDGTKYVYHELTRRETADDGSISYFVDDKKVTKEEFDAREALLSQEEAPYKHLAIYPLRAWFPGG